MSEPTRPAPPIAAPPGTASARQRAALEKELVASFTTEADLRAFADRVNAAVHETPGLVSDNDRDRDVVTPHIPFGGGLANAVFELLQLCKARGFERPLFEALVAARPGRTHLALYRELADVYGVSLPRGDPTPPPGSAPWTRDVRRALVLSLPLPGLLAALFLFLTLKSRGFDRMVWAWFFAYEAWVPATLLYLFLRVRAGAPLATGRRYTLWGVALLDIAPALLAFQRHYAPVRGELIRQPLAHSFQQSAPPAIVLAAALAAAAYALAVGRRA